MRIKFARVKLNVLNDNQQCKVQCNESLNRKGNNLQQSNITPDLDNSIRMATNPEPYA